MTKLHHIPVLAQELVDLVPLKKSDGIYFDGTFGLGGHSKFLSGKLSPDSTIIATEWDQRLKKFHSNLGFKTFIKIFYDSFSRFDFILASQGIKNINGAILDLGFSSVHIDEALMGFSFQKDADLDMRYSEEIERDAANILNQVPEKELCRILLKYGEEPLSKKVAREIVRRRNKRPFKKTLDFVEFLKEVLPSHKGYPMRGIRRIFQALRIEVNRELENLNAFLQKVSHWLRNKNDWLAIISYHSLEDRMVKKHFTQLTQECICLQEEPICRCNHLPEFTWLKKVIKPSPQEVESNPRSASARMRIIQRLNDGRNSIFRKEV